MDLLKNKKVHHSYEIMETFEAGIKLAGWEVKSLRNKHGSLNESYVTLDSEVWLVNAYIPAYQSNHALRQHDDAYRKRKLLLSKKQIDELRESQKQKGLTIVPIRMYSKGALIKIEVAIARGKKLHDKRKMLKERTTKREAQRAIKE